MYRSITKRYWPYANILLKIDFELCNHLQWVNGRFQVNVCNNHPVTVKQYWILCNSIHVGHKNKVQIFIWWWVLTDLNGSAFEMMSWSHRIDWQEECNLIVKRVSWSYMHKYVCWNIVCESSPALIICMMLKTLAVLACRTQLTYCLV